MYNLYVLDSCPYCRKVIDFMEDNNISYNKFDVSNPKYYEELISLGGKSQVPFLVDKGTDNKLYESDDIIHYLKNK